VRDFVEACLDVAFYDPLVGAGGEVMDLGDRVVGAASGAEAVTARQEVRLEDRLEHQFEGGLYHPVGHGRDAKTAAFAARLGDHRFAYRHRLEPPCLEFVSQPGEEDLLALHGRDVGGGRPVHPGRAGPSVAPHPLPGHRQDSRVIDQVVEVVEATFRILDGPLVQLGLDPQYPLLGLFEARPQITGVHQWLLTFRSCTAN
jgi:hypothetical protein